MSTDLSALLKQFMVEISKPQANSTGGANSANGTQTDNGITNQGEDNKDSVTIGGQSKGLGDGAIPDLDDNKGVLAFFAMILSAIMDTIKGLTDTVAKIAENQNQATQQTQQANNTNQATQQTQQANNTNQTTTNNKPATTTNAAKTNATVTKPKHEDGEFVTHDSPNKGETTKETYKNGVLVSKKITNGKLSSEEKYNSKGQLTETIKKDGNSTWIEKREYDSDGNISKRVVTDGDGVKNIYQTLSTTKDAKGNTVAKIKRTVVDKNGKTVAVQIEYETRDDKDRPILRKYYDENDENILYEQSIKYDGDSKNYKEVTTTAYTTDKTGKSVVDYIETNTNYKYETGKKTYDYVKKDSKGKVIEKGTATYTTKEVKSGTYKALLKMIEDNADNSNTVYVASNSTSWFSYGNTNNWSTGSNSGSSYDSGSSSSDGGDTYTYEEQIADMKTVLEDNNFDTQTMSNEEIEDVYQEGLKNQ